MAQYQSFPGAAGASRTLDKLKALKLPALAGRSFLDIGCNEGFFCGFAKFLGADRVIGLDKSALFIERARTRFPDCEFLQQDWDALPDGSFDVILLASALHYADDQTALIRRLVDRLSPDGTLVLEMGIASAPGNEWVEVERGIDTRFFPTMAKLREVMGDYAWKWMGRSVSQAGDPVSRHVVHVNRRRPLAYLLMQPPAYGKSSIAARLSAKGGVPVVSGDQSIASIAQGTTSVSDALRKLVAQDYSPFRIDVVVERIFEQRAEAELVDVWARSAGSEDFVLDMFVPVEHQPRVAEHLSRLGYLPVGLSWDRVGPPLLSPDELADRAQEFHGTIVALEPIATADSLQARAMRGFVDELSLDSGALLVRGWAIDEDGSLPEMLAVRLRGKEYLVRDLAPQSRPDVQQHLDLPHPQVGYSLRLEIPGLDGVADIGTDFSVAVPGRGPLRLTERVRGLLHDDPA